MGQCHALISKLALIEVEQMKIHSKLWLYPSAEGMFGNPMAKKIRAKLAVENKNLDSSNVPLHAKVDVIDNSTLHMY
ncbi:hypothetical protein HanHA300_Chr16g0599981 [Helianthus annuus]|nr:hypothetical protein HanHA300_Chr16g0599981 [Helianthus annuus]KAJ0459567.1 hypothetical protein HanHA89_Chr16g0650431 [Helianthus annuus]